MMNNPLPERFWPFNIQAARPTSPNESPPEFHWKSRMAFPVSSHGSIHTAHLVFLLKIFVILCMISVMAQGLSTHPDGSFAIGFIAATSIGIGVFFAIYGWAELSIARQVVLVLVSVCSGAAVFHANSFLVLQIVGAVAGFWLVDRFVLHSIMIRSTAPHFEVVQDQFAQLARSRFWPLPTRQLNLFTFWAPLFVYTWVVFEFKKYDPENNLIDSIALQLRLITFLLLWPVAYSVFTISVANSPPKNVWMIREFVRGVQSFLYYNQVNARHPFAFQSPAGTATSRQVLITAAILLTAPVTLHDVISADRPGLPVQKVSDFHSSVPSHFVVSAKNHSGREIVTRLIVAGLICMLNAVLVMVTPIALCFACSANLLARLTREGFPTPLESKFTTANWQKLVEHMRTVDGGKFRHHVLMGVNAYDGTPVIMPREALREHMHVLGETGSGKTSMGLAPLVEQLSTFGDCSVVVFDLKGDDQTLPAILRTAAALNSGLPTTTAMDPALWRYPYRYFHPSPDFPSHSFNPMQQRIYRIMTNSLRAELLAQSMGLVYGNDYGKKFYTDENLKRLLDIICSNPDARSFEELFYLLQLSARNSGSRSDSQSSNVDSSVARLAEVPSLNQLPVNGTDPFAHARIDLIDLFERPQALLFTLPAATGNSSNEDIARIVLYMLIEAAQCAKQPRHQVFVVIDEFQRIVSSKIGNLLQIARSNDVALILANQSLGDLKTACGGEAYSAISGNTRIRQYFSLRDSVDVSDLMKSSGECTIYNMSFTTMRRVMADGIRDVETVTYSQQISTRLRPNDIIEASDHPNRSIFHMFRGIGAAQFQGYPFILHGVHHISKAEHKRRSLLKWPAPTPSTSIIVPHPFRLERQQAGAKRQAVPALLTTGASLTTAPKTVNSAQLKPVASPNSLNPLSHLVPQGTPSRNVAPSPLAPTSPQARPQHQQTTQNPKQKPTQHQQKTLNPKPKPHQQKTHNSMQTQSAQQQTENSTSPQTTPQQKTPQPTLPRQSNKTSPTDRPNAPLPSQSAPASQRSTSPKPSSSVPASSPTAPPFPDPSLNPALEKLREKLNKVREKRFSKKPR